MICHWIYVSREEPFKTNNLCTKFFDVRIVVISHEILLTRRHITSLVISRKP